MTSAADASVVICAYATERWPDLKAAIASVQAQTLPPRELILVIDRNEALLARASSAFPALDVISNDHEGGISGARNTGTARATGAIVVFLDDDAIAEPDWLEHLLAPYADPAVLGVGGQILPLWRYGRPAWFPAEFNWIVGCTYLGLPEQRSRVRNPIGASLSARRAVLDALGGFDHSMGRVSAADHVQVSGTADETELCIRATKRWPSCHWLYEPDARVHHVVPSSRLSLRFFVGRCQMEGVAKARLSAIAGATESLASERRYVQSVLPRGVVRELSAALRGDLGGAGRAAAIVAGTAITALTYARTGLSLALSRRTVASG